MALAEKAARGASSTGPGHDDRRPPHLRVPRRRLHDGRHLARSLLRSPARSKLGKLIAFYDDNGISIDGEVARLVHRRHAEALRGLRLARDARRRRPRRRGDQGRAGIAQRKRSGQADADLLQDHHRQGRAEQAGQGKRARRARWARRKSPPRARRSAGRIAPFEIPDDIYAGWDAQAKGAAREAEWNALFARYRNGASRISPPNSSAA